jgi:ketosteroid isomerase-like protein
MNEISQVAGAGHPPSRAQARYFEPMTDKEMIAALRRLHDAFNRGDFDAAAQLAHPDVELVRAGGMSPVKGVAALREWMEPDAIEEPRLEPLDFRVNGDKVLVREHVTGRGAGSGIEVDLVGYVVWTLDDHGLVTKAQLFTPHEEAEALEAAWLSE